MIKMVLFDLDGTLLPMDQEVFIKAYFGGIVKRLVNYGYEPDKLIKGIWEGTMNMVKNDGSKTNEEVFWNRFCELFGDKARLDEPHFEEFYINDFDKIQGACGFDPNSRVVIDEIKKLGLRTVLATNPIFPRIATQKRINWAGLTTDDFEVYTTYENSSYCKPNLEYYISIINKLGVKPEECLMVGNDVIEDMVTENLGMKVFLVTNCLINKNNIDINKYPNGNLMDLLDYIKTLI